MTADWLHHPQRVWLRRALFQVHLWTGIAVGLYIFFISVTGSVLVYRNELYEAVMPNAFDGSESITGYRMVSGLIQIHTDFFAGDIGRQLNGVGAIATLVLALTGLVIWWPGVKHWRRSLIIQHGVGWKRTLWDLHSALGFWSFAFTVMFAVSGILLCYTEWFYNIGEWLVPTTPANAGVRWVDKVQYWVTFSHFGRINGIGLPCSGPGLCDQSVKAVWALFGIAPAVMFVTGATLWWSRVLRPWWRRLQRKGDPRE
ncbi:MAG TPA: PepSY-associated TM helix domain-containing protein [Candidatus Acidoferrum sp.]|nr:PepSY-associated TM helix domain-containing protein [Candidatus Acidoferrum sp.]